MHAHVSLDAAILKRVAQVEPGVEKRRVLQDRAALESLSRRDKQALNLVKRWVRLGSGDGERAGMQAITIKGKQEI